MKNDYFSLEQIIYDCVYGRDDAWEKAWTEFLNRYKHLLYFFIRRSCESWNYGRLNLQLKETVNDIFSEVIIIIYKKLSTFKNTDSENKFIAWLQIICSRTTTAFIKRKLKNVLHEDDLVEFEEYKDVHKDEKLMELFDNLISMLRNELKNNKNAERDINIFMLKTWTGLSTKQIMLHPFYKGLSEININVILNRVRKNIKPKLL